MKLKQIDFLTSFVTGQHDYLNCLHFFSNWGGVDKNLITEIFHNVTHSSTKLGCYMIAWLRVFQMDLIDFFICLDF